MRGRWAPRRWRATRPCPLFRSERVRARGRLDALGDEPFTIRGPYVVNVPPMVAHAFVDVGEDLAELVVIFPTNVWEYDVLDHFPFKDLDAAKKKARRIEGSPARPPR